MKESQYIIIEYHFTWEDDETGRNEISKIFGPYSYSEALQNETKLNAKNRLTYVSYELKQLEDIR
jgi:hypothetical protein